MEMARPSLIKGAVGNMARAMRQDVKDHMTHIQLRNIPPTATPTDLRRLVTRSKLEGVTDVALDYQRFLTSGRAYLTLSHPDFLRSNLDALQNTSISSISVTAVASDPPLDVTPLRTRGTAGRVDASQRGIIVGNGIRAGLLNPAKNVVLWGLPGKMTPEALKKVLKRFKLAGSDGGKQEVAKVEMPDRTFTLFSRHLVRVSSVSEAHRLVRAMHMTYFEPQRWGKKYRIQARVIY